MANNRLGLDEALISVNKSPILEPLEVYHQIDECFGCPLDKLATLQASKLVDEFVIGTKFKQQIELRNSNNDTLCRLINLNLNNHAHYRIDLEPVAKGSSSATRASIECTWRTIDKGDCYLCPAAMLIVFVLLVTLAEKVYSRFSTPTKKTTEQVEPIEQVETETEAETDRQSGADLERSGDNCADQSQQAPEQEQNQSTTSKKRIEALDAFRGLTITGMIMVNYGGAGYTFLEHEPWDGLTPADLVFPFFVFSMGASIAMSARRALAKRHSSVRQVFCKILRRSAVLMALGLCLNSKWLNGNGLDKLRLTGVLQRFSISYLVVALMFTIELAVKRWLRAQSLFYRPRLVSCLMGVLFELLTALNFLAVYLYVTFYLDYSDTCPPGYTGPGGQTAGGQYAECTGGAAAWLDRTLLGEGHLYNDLSLKRIFKTNLSHDPEGLLGYTTSILLTLIGLQCGKILIQFKSNKTRLLMFSTWCALLTLASTLIILIPVNKRLWSLTFVTISGVFAYLLLASLYLLMDVYNCQRTFFLRLLISAGKNSIFLYVGHSLLSNMLPWHFAVDETSHFQLMLRLAWAAFVWLLVAHYMSFKRLFIKI